MKDKYDVVIIGSGLGGLVTANIMAREGKSVIVLEKNNQYGGNLQIFARDKSIFDTGVHYIGGLAPGQNLHQYFSYLGIMDDLKLKRLDIDHYDLITFGNDHNEYPHAQGYANFVQRLSVLFPEHQSEIITYCDKIREVCNSFPLYNLEIGTPYHSNSDLLTLKVTDFLDQLTDNDKLKSVLAGSNLLYAGIKDKTPFYVHALSVNSYIQSAYRCINGGSQIAKLLIRKLKFHGGEAYKRQQVVGGEFENGELLGVRTSAGKLIKGDLFISNVDPKQTIKIIGEKMFRKSYVNRIQDIESIVSAFSMYIVFKPESFAYYNYNYYHFRDGDNIWDAHEYDDKTWPKGYMLSMSATETGKWADNMTAITYMNYDDVSAWDATKNTVVDKKDRGEAYQKFKAEKIEIFLTELEVKFPKIREAIHSVYASTPLSYRDYIGVDRGSMYGFVKDADNPMKSFLSPRTRVKNLFFTGQSLNMHGILGVTISAVLTCSEILGKEYLLDKIKSELKV